jgi:predicted O-methyltransferase YrrM
MAFTTRVKESLNRGLRPLNLRVDTLTARRIEEERIAALERARHFERPVFPLPPGFRSLDPKPVLDAVAAFRPRFTDFEDPARNDVGYSFDNIFYTSPDAEVLYALVRSRSPGKILEVGSGNSTKIIRQAIRDGSLPTRLVSIDPSPRLDIRHLADESRRAALGSTSDLDRLDPGDFLFIDSSHVIRTGNDAVFLYLEVLPRVPAGAIVQVHDVFLPYDYPKRWVLDWEFNEQYLVQAILQFGGGFDVLWAGHYLQRSLPDFADHFPHAAHRTATSLWLLKTR